MRIVSDLTKDTRPSLEEILKESIHDTIELDIDKPNDNGELVEYENHTFYYRVIFLFMQRVIGFYTDKEVETWTRRELLKEVVLPELEDYRTRKVQ